MSKQHQNAFIKNVEEKKLPDGPDFLRGKEDNQNIKLFTISEEVEMIREQEKVNTIGKEHRDQEGRVKFGGMLSSGPPIFQRHEYFRAWSQWEEVLFCCPTPTLVPLGYREGTKLQLTDRDVIFPSGKYIHRVKYNSYFEGEEDVISLFRNWMEKK